jgi:hypothetical protein
MSPSFAVPVREKEKEKEKKQGPSSHAKACHSQQGPSNPINLKGCVHNPHSQFLYNLIHIDKEEG